MAYVAISNALIDGTRDAIKNLRTRELRSLPDVPELEAFFSPANRSPDAVAAQETLQLLLWGEYADLRPRIGHIKHSSYVHMHVYQLPEGSDQYIPIQASGVQGLPAGTIRTYDTMHIDFPCVAKKSDLYLNEQQIPQLKPILDNVAARREVEKRWDDIVSQVSDFLRSAKSLNEAAKLWPDVLRYVPQEYVERLNKKTEKAAKEESAALEALKRLDLDTITSSTVIARMSSPA